MRLTKEEQASLFRAPQGVIGLTKILQELQRNLGGTIYCPYQAIFEKGRGVQKVLEITPTTSRHELDMQFFAQAQTTLCSSKLYALISTIADKSAFRPLPSLQQPRSVRGAV